MNIKGINLCKRILIVLVCISLPVPPTYARNLFKVLDSINDFMWRETLHMIGVEGKEHKYRPKKDKNDHQFRHIERNKIDQTENNNEKQKKPGSDKNAVDRKSQKVKKVKFEDIAGLDHILAEIKEVADYLRNPEKYHALGAYVPTGILLEGPPGVGKTMIAQAVATEVDCDFFCASGSEFVELFVGQGAARVRELFANARKKRPAIIFIDEIDALGTKRNGSHGGSREYDQTLNQLLIELQGFEDMHQVAVIAATNRADMLDPALKRPGRLTRILPINLPDAKARKAIIELYISKKPRVDHTGISIPELVGKTKGFSGAEIKDMINEAALLAVRAQAYKIGKEHMDKALAKALQNKQTRS